MTSLRPPTGDSLEEVISIFQPWDSAYREYMRKISAANRVASSPPVPARISSTTSLSSLGSRGRSRILISSSMRASSGSRRATSSWAMARISGSPSCSMGRASARSLWTFFHWRYVATISEMPLCSLVTARYLPESEMTAGSAICCVSSSKRFSRWSSFWVNCMAGYATTNSPPWRCSRAMAPSRARMATSVWSSAGGLVVMRWSHSPGAVRAARTEPRRLAA